METILDVTVLDPRQKHPTIFNRFDALAEGDALTIHNDHDPKPLYYQMIHERGSTFLWEYLEEGPVWWKVKITKNSPEQRRKTVGEIAAKDLRKAEVFKKYGIDFCCGGKKTIEEACSEKGIDILALEKDLDDVANTAKADPGRANEWSLNTLVDYIVNTHHSYVKKTLPELKKFAYKVATVHGSGHPELARISACVEAIDEELTHHLVKEEEVLFPFIKELVVAGQMPSRVKTPFGTIRNPITMMEVEHENAGKLLEEIRQLSKNFQLPEEACASYSLLFSMLEEFEADLHIHIHLENNILFPKALALEKASV